MYLIARKYGLLNLKHFAKLELTSVNEILLSLSKLQMRFLLEAVLGIGI